MAPYRVYGIEKRCFKEHQNKTHSIKYEFCTGCPKTTHSFWRSGMAYHRRRSGGELPCVWTLSQKTSLLLASPHCDWYWQFFFFKILEHSWLTNLSHQFLVIFLFVEALQWPPCVPAWAETQSPFGASLGCYFQHRLLPSARGPRGFPEPFCIPKEMDQNLSLTI